MPKIKMLEKLSPYKVTYLADRPGEIGAKLYAKKVFAGNDRDAVIAFNNWFDTCKAFPEGSSCDIQKVELIQGEAANKSYTFTWWGNEPTADRRPTTRADLKNCLNKKIFLAVDDAEALKLAMEYLCDDIGVDPEDVADTPEKIWDHFNSDWGSGDPIPMVLKQRNRVVKDSGFNPNREDYESANESDNPVGELFDALKQALDGKGYKVSQFTSDKEFVGQRKAYDGISIENEDPNAYHKNPYRIVLDTDANLFRIFFPHVRRKSVTGQPGSISGIVKFILRDLNLDESKKKNPSKDFSSNVEEDEDGRKKSH